MNNPIKADAILCQIDEIVAFVYNHSQFGPDDLRRVASKMERASQMLFSVETELREYLKQTPRTDAS